MGRIWQSRAKKKYKKEIEDCVKSRVCVRSHVGGVRAAERKRRDKNICGLTCTRDKRQRGRPWK